MKYSPKSLGAKNNVNISDRHPLHDAIVLTAGVFVVVLGLYLVLGFAADFIVHRYENQVNRFMGDLFFKDFNDSPTHAKQQKRLQEIVNEMCESLPEKPDCFRVHVLDAPVVNALAYPGGDIVVYSGLLDQAESENEVAMILGHEIGHYLNKDHIQGVGRGLVLLSFSVALLGEDSSVTQVISSTLNIAQRNYSHDQETEADEVGLILLQRTYGHICGSTDFFERLAKSEDTLLYSLFSESHPLSMKRTNNIRKWIKEKGFVAKPCIPLIKSNKSEKFGSQSQDLQCLPENNSLPFFLDP